VSTVKNSRDWPTLRSSGMARSIGRLCGSSGLVVFLCDGRSAKLREELIEAI
jgi:hypothetical protein